MPDLTGPLFSLTASGTIGKTLTYSRWRGIKYTRTRVIPANPKSTNQVKIRAVFSNLSRLWKVLPTFGQAPYQAASAGKPFTDRNLVVHTNAKNLYDNTDWDQYAGSPGFGGAPSPTAMVLTGGAGDIAVNLTVGQLPTGWTLLSGYAMCLLRDPAPTTLRAPVVFSDDDADPTALHITGLVDGTQYSVTAWATYTKPDGSTAYSTSRSNHATA